AFKRSDEDKQAALHALTKLAVFSQEAEVRRAAVAALKDRAQSADAATLLRGLHYPWPSVAESSAEAVVELKRKDLIPDLIKMLDEPDPRAPVVRENKAQKVVTVREVVKINHHRNCLLCHPPGNTPDVMTLTSESTPREIEKGVEAVSCFISKQADDVVVGAIPTAGQA